MADVLENAGIHAVAGTQTVCLARGEVAAATQTSPLTSIVFS